MRFRVGSLFRELCRPLRGHLSRSARAALERARGRDYCIHEGLALPPRWLRFCGEAYRDDAYFVSSAEREVQRLRDFGLSTRTRLLELGCGPGRFAIGLLRRLGEMDAYHGLDVDRASIRWCKRHITRSHPSFRFTRIDVHNLRYNRRGWPLDEGPGKCRDLHSRVRASAIAEGQGLSNRFPRGRCSRCDDQPS